MPRSVWDRTDVAGMLTGAAVIMLATAAHSTTPVEFIDGALAFARAQAQAFGIPWQDVAGELGSGWVGLEAGTDG